MLTLEEIKDHLRIDQADASEDDYLNQISAAAHDHIEQYLNRPVPWTDENENPVAIPASIKQAALLIIGDLFENREGKIIGISSTDNPVVYHFLYRYRIGLGI